MERQASTPLSVIRPNGIIGALQQAGLCSICVAGYAARSRCCKRRFAIVMGLNLWCPSKIPAVRSTQALAGVSLPPLWW